MSLDVALLLDDPSELSGRDGNESFLSVSGAVAAIEAALFRLGHRCRLLPFVMGVGKVVETLQADRPDVVFHLGQPLPTDPAGEMQVAALLDLMGVAHTSESPETLILACDKARAKALCAHHGISTPAYAVSESGALPSALPPPAWIAKPSLEDGSVGIHCHPPATDRATLAERVRELHARYDEPVLIETFVGTRELQVGFVGSDILPIVEIDFSGLPPRLPRMTGHETKWHQGSVEWRSVHYTCPASLTEDQGKRLGDLARSAARAFSIQRCTRLDVRMDQDGGLYLIDVNPNPDLSPLESMDVMARVAGWGFDGLVQRLLDLAGKPRAKGR